MRGENKGKTMNVQKRTWQIVEVAKPGDTVSRVFDIFILSLIFLNVVAIIIGSVESIEQRYGTFLYHFEVLSVAIFTIEYIARVWSCVADKKYSKAISGRVKFMLHPLPLIEADTIVHYA
jgi:voltage-gated potassium channel